MRSILRQIADWFKPVPLSKSREHELIRQELANGEVREFYIRTVPLFTVRRHGWRLDWNVRDLIFNPDTNPTCKRVSKEEIAQRAKAQK